MIPYRTDANAEVVTLPPPTEVFPYGRPTISTSVAARVISQTAILIAFFVCVLLVQRAVGAYRTDRSNYPDEASHFMNALLVRDYLTHGLSESPMQFAEEYYLSYPKVAFLVWPPLFHLALGVFLLPGWPAHPAALAFVALIAALGAWRLQHILRQCTSRTAAILAGCAFLLVPIVVDVSTAVMVDILVAVLGLEAVYWLSRFMSSGAGRHAVLFGLCTALCCLTKGNGLAVTLVPILMIPIAGRFDVLRRSALYVAPVIVIVLAGPFLFKSYQFTAAMGDYGSAGLHATVTRVALYAAFLWSQLTPIPVLFALIGSYVALAPRRSPQASASARLAGQAFLALTLATVVFHSLLPMTYPSGRYMLLGVAPLIGLAAIGIHATLDWPRSEWRRTAGLVVCAVMLLSFVAWREVSWSVRRPLGYDRVVSFLASRGELSGRRVLVVSDEEGEGAFVSEVAMRGPTPVPTLIRGSKLLAESDWMDNDFRVLFDSPEKILQELEDLHVDTLVVDFSPEAARLRYWSQVKTLLDRHPDAFEQILQTTIDPQTGPKRALAVFRLKQQSPGSPKTLRVSLRYSLGKVLER
jgi:Dolichyl-phosphate-mannose-protein mannosyltransferase